MYRFLSADDLDRMMRLPLNECLPALGLTGISARTWMECSKRPARRLFELQLLKGASLKACWGWSLDFVLHISGGRVRWHRSGKSARLTVGDYLVLCRPKGRS